MKGAFAPAHACLLNPEIPSKERIVDHMKTLLVLRHAKASRSDPSLADFDRPLKKRGLADASRIGRLLRDRDLVPALILASPARRALRTAELVAEEVRYDGDSVVTDDFYPGDPEDYVAALRRLADDLDPVLVVGHNPGLELLVEELTGQDPTLPTAALAHVTLPIGRWADLEPRSDGTLVAVWIGRDVPD